MIALIADLDNDIYERVEEEQDKRGIELGVSLFGKYRDKSPIVITSPSAESIRFPCSAVFSIVYLSPITGRMALSFSSYAPGLSLRALGYDAFVICGKAKTLSYLSVGSEGTERTIAVQYSGLSAAAFESAVRKGMNEVFLAIGRAAENGVLFSQLQSGGREIQGEGLGVLLAGKNIKGISFPSFPRKDFLGSGKEERRVRERLEKGRLPKRIRRDGGGIFIDKALECGFLPVADYTLRYDPRAYYLDGKAYNERYGVYREACQDCFFSCNRRRQDDSPLPTWKESMALGSNLGFFDAESVAAIADAARSEGLSVLYTGTILSAIKAKEGALSIDECIESIHVLADGKISFHTLMDSTEAVLMEDGSPVLFDLRGSYAASIASVFSFPVLPASSILISSRHESVRSAAVMALYEEVYSLALISRGYSAMCSLSEWWGRFPSFLYTMPPIARFIAEHFRAFGLSARELEQEGMRILSIFASKPVALPDAFTLNPDSAFPCVRTLPFSLIVGTYEKEKGSLERKLKSRREKSARNLSSKSAAVGPDDERGRDGDPGLTT